MPANTLTFSLSGEPVGSVRSIRRLGCSRGRRPKAQGPGSYTFDVVVTDDGAPNLYGFGDDHGHGQ